MTSFILLAGSVAAQSVYAGGMVAADAGRHGTFDLGTFPAAGGFVGLRFHDAWSIEFHMDHGFGKSATRERIEIFGTSIVQDQAGTGRSVYFTWKSRRPGRVGVAATMGVSLRPFSTRRLSFTKVNPNDPYPVSDVASRDGGAGWSGGVLVPIALGGRWSLAPETRFTFGLTGEHGEYVQFYSGVRMMWGF